MQGKSPDQFDNETLCGNIICIEKKDLFPKCNIIYARMIGLFINGEKSNIDDYQINIKTLYKNQYLDILVQDVYTINNHNNYIYFPKELRNKKTNLNVFEKINLCKEYDFKIYFEILYFDSKENYDQIKELIE